MRKRPSILPKLAQIIQVAEDASSVEANYQTLEGRLARFYFHIHDGHDAFDQSGTECASLKAVQKHMLDLALMLSSREPKILERPWQIEALDESGKIVGTLEIDR